MPSSARERQLQCDYLPSATAASSARVMGTRGREEPEWQAREQVHLEVWSLRVQGADAIASLLSSPSRTRSTRRCSSSSL